MKKIIKPIIAILFILILAIVLYCILQMPVSKSIEEKEIVIPMGCSATNIANILKENNLIKSKLIFRLYVKLNNISNFQAGTYYLKESMNLKEITEMLQTGIMFDPNQITITYLEGKPMWWLVKTISEKTDNTEEDIYAVLADEEYIDELIEKYWYLTDEIKNENIYYPLEGYLFPDTYAISGKDCDVKEIFKKMLDKMESVLNEYKEEIEESEYSVHELLSLASVVETESMNYEHRKNIASVFYNRLENGMALGSDVTTYYAIKVDMGDRKLYQKEIDKYNPYNTRGPNMEGKLPVGPISSVGKSSIEAVVNPNDTNYLFFVSDKDRVTYFTETFAEHNKLINELIDKGLWYEF